MISPAARRLLAALVPLLLLSPLPAQAADFHIIDGQPADPGEYPAMAALTFADEGFQFCGGTLVAAEWIMTAAHCFYDSRVGGNGTPPEAIEVVLDTTDWTVGGERLGIDRIVLNPNYDDFRTVNDIALLHLSTPATTTPATLVTAADSGFYAPSRPAVVTGYGATTPEGGAPSTRLLEAGVPLVDDTSCARSYDLEPARHVCAGDPGTEADPGPDTCQGDSGGPLWTDRGDGVLALIGITSFGGLCGVEAPGVYTEVITYLDWVEGVIDGSIPDNAPVDPTLPDIPDDATVPPSRVADPAGGPTTAVAQAIAVSRAVFRDDGAAFGVVATSATYPDALGGSALAYGVAPLLFTGAGGSLDADTLLELQRALPDGAQVYLLGGEAVIPASTVAQLEAAGFLVTRLSGLVREETAARVATEVVSRLGVLPFGTVMVVTSANWPDAVTVGQIGAWWGIPVLLTPPGSLHPETAAAIEALGAVNVLVAGGTSAVADPVVDAIAAIEGVGQVSRLGGETRFETAAAVTRYDVDELYNGEWPRYIIGVNLSREPDGFAHVLSASMLAGGFNGVMAPVEGDGGVTVPQSVADSICGIAVPVILAGGTDLIADAAGSALAESAGGTGCSAGGVLSLGDSAQSAITEALPVRRYTFDGTAGLPVRIRMDIDASPVDQDGALVDPVVRLLGPNGTVIATNDDSEEEPRLNALLAITLPLDGEYTIEATRFADTTGRFVLTLDTGLILDEVGQLSQEQPTVDYEVTGPPGARLVAEMRRIGDRTDPLLVVVDAAGAEVAGDDDGGGFPNARLSVAVPADGRLRIRAQAFGDFVGPYRILLFDPGAAGLTVSVPVAAPA